MHRVSDRIKEDNIDNDASSPDACHRFDADEAGLDYRIVGDEQMTMMEEEGSRYR
jgi:hypothetical protein